MKWTSSKKSVAAVSKKGKITAKKAGKAVIRCKVKYIAKASKKAKTKTLKCRVVVKKNTKGCTGGYKSTAENSCSNTDHSANGCTDHSANGCTDLKSDIDAGSNTGTNRDTG